MCRWARTWTAKDRSQSPSPPRSRPRATPALEHHRSTGPISPSTRSTSPATAAASVTSSPAASGAGQAKPAATPLAAQRELVAELPDLGYTDVWSSEVDGADAFTPLVLASVWAPALRLGTAIAPVFTRGPPWPGPG